MTRLNAPKTEREEREGRTESSGSPIRARIFGTVLVVLSILWLFAANGFEQQAFPIAVGVLTTAGVYAISALGLNLHFGYTGLLQIGHVAFMAIGAYTTVLLIPHVLGRVGARSDGIMPLLPAVIVGMAAAAFLGLLLGIPTLRLRGDYLAIVTIAVGEIIRLLLRTQAFEGLTGGVFGILGFSGMFQDLRPGFIDQWAESLNTTPVQFWTLLITWVVVVLTVAFLWVLVRSPWGRVLRAIREDEDAARALGKNTFWYKQQSLMIGGSIGGLAGVLFAFDQNQVNPDTFLPIITFFVFTIMILGGSATLSGPVAGSIIFWVILNQTDDIAEIFFNFVGVEVTGQTVSGARLVLIGLGIMLLMIYRPQGLFGKREELILELK